MSCYWHIGTFVWASLFFRSALWVAMETMQFHIAQMGLFLWQYFSHLNGLTNHLLPNRRRHECATLV